MKSHFDTYLEQQILNNSCLFLLNLEMKKVSRLPLRLASKENLEVKSQCKKHPSFKNLQEPIEEWKQYSDRVILTDTTNQCRTKKYSLPSKSRFSTHQSVFGNEEYNMRKFSQIEVLKKQAEFLQQQNMYQQRTKTQFMKTQPLHCMQMIPIKLDNWLKTTNNGFFRSQQRHSILQKKRNRIKRLRKIDIMKMNIITQSSTKVFKQQIFKEIQQINKPIILYPLMDTIYHDEIKQRLNTAMLPSKRTLKRQKNLSNCKQSRVSNRQDPIRIKTLSNWKNQLMLQQNLRLSTCDSQSKQRCSRGF